MSWKENLQPASFRGVALQVESDDTAFGRRVQVHEYPQRDKPYAEDNGRKAREPSLTAFLIGADYMAARDKLLEAVEQSGPGELVHPWYGRMTVTVTECRVTHSREDGGMVRVQLAFVESGELAFPAAGNAPGAQTLLAADVLQDAAITDFSKRFSIDNLPEFAVTDAADTLASMLDALDASLRPAGSVLASPVASLKAVIGSLLPQPTTLAQRLFGLFSKGDAVLKSASPGISGGDFAARNFQRAFSTIRARDSFPASVRSVSLTPTRTQIYDNRDALAALTRRALLVQASGMTAAMPLPVYDDAAALRRELLAALDAEASSADDTTYGALMGLRAKAHTDISSRLQNSARLKTITPGEVQPALALAYDLYEDSARDGEIIARNRLRHPGFVPAEKLKVLSA